MKNNGLHPVIETPTQPAVPAATPSRTDPQPVAWACWDLAFGCGAKHITSDRQLVDARLKRPNSWRVEPLYASPSSAGTVSVEAAARVLLEACPNPIFDVLKPALMGEIRETVWQMDEYGDEVSVDRQVPWDTMKTVIRAALRALAGERG